MTKIVCGFTWCRHNEPPGICGKEEIYVRCREEKTEPICDDFAVKENLVGPNWQRRI